MSRPDSEGGRGALAGGGKGRKGGDSTAGAMEKVSIGTEVLRPQQQLWKAATDPILTGDEYCRAVRAVASRVQEAVGDKGAVSELNSVLWRLVQSRHNAPLPLWWTFTAVEKAVGLDRKSKEPLEFGAAILDLASRILGHLTSFGAVYASGQTALSAIAPVVGLLFDVACLLNDCIGSVDAKKRDVEEEDGKGKKCVKVVKKLKELIREMQSFTFLCHCRDSNAFGRSLLLPLAPNVPPETFPGSLYPAFPLASKRMARSLGEDFSNVAVVSGIVSVEILLLQLAVEIMERRRRLKKQNLVSSAGQDEFVGKLKRLAVHSIWAGSALSLLEMLLNLLLEERLPVLDILEVQEETLVRGVLFESVLVDPPLFSLPGQGSGNSPLSDADANHESVVFMKKIAVAREAVKFFRTQEEHSRLATLSNKMTTWHFPPHFLKWLKSEKKLRFPVGAVQDHQTLTNWLLKSADESAFREILDKTVVERSPNLSARVDGSVELSEVANCGPISHGHEEEALFFVDTAGEAGTETNEDSAADLEFAVAAKNMKGICDSVKKEKKTKGSKLLFHRHEQVSTGIRRRGMEVDDIGLVNSSGDDSDENLRTSGEKQMEESGNKDEEDSSALSGENIVGDDKDEEMTSILVDHPGGVPRKWSAEGGNELHEDQQLLQKTQIPAHESPRRKEAFGNLTNGRAVEDGAVQFQYQPAMGALVYDQDIGTQGTPAFLSHETQVYRSSCRTRKGSKARDSLIDAGDAATEKTPSRPHEELVMASAPLNERSDAHNSSSELLQVEAVVSSVSKSAKKKKTDHLEALDRGPPAEAAFESEGRLLLASLPEENGAFAHADAPQEGVTHLTRSVKKKKPKDPERTDVGTQETSEQGALEASAYDESKTGLGSFLGGSLLASPPEENAGAPEDVPMSLTDKVATQYTRSAKKKKPRDGGADESTQGASQPGDQGGAAEKGSKMGLGSFSDGSLLASPPEENAGAQEDVPMSLTDKVATHYTRSAKKKKPRDGGADESTQGASQPGDQGAAAEKGSKMGLGSFSDGSLLASPPEENAGAQEDVPMSLTDKVATQYTRSAKKKKPRDGGADESTQGASQPGDQGGAAEKGSTLGLGSFSDGSLLASPPEENAGAQEDVPMSLTDKVATHYTRSAKKKKPRDGGADESTQGASQPGDQGAAAEKGSKMGLGSFSDGSLLASPPEENAGAQEDVPMSLTDKVATQYTRSAKKKKPRDGGADESTQGASQPGDQGGAAEKGSKMGLGSFSDGSPLASPPEENAGAQEDVPMSLTDKVATQYTRSAKKKKPRDGGADESTQGASQPGDQGAAAEKGSKIGLGSFSDGSLLASPPEENAGAQEDVPMSLTDKVATQYTRSAKKKKPRDGGADESTQGASQPGDQGGAAEKGSKMGLGSFSDGSPLASPPEENAGAQEDVPMSLTDKVATHYTRSAKKKKPRDGGADESTQGASQPGDQGGAAEKGSKMGLGSFSDGSLLDSLPEENRGSAHVDVPTLLTEEVETQLTRSVRMKKPRDPNKTDEIGQGASQSGVQEASAEQELKTGLGSGLDRSLVASPPEENTGFPHEDVPTLLTEEVVIRHTRSGKKRKPRDNGRTDECIQGARQPGAQETSAEEESKMGLGSFLDGSLLDSLPEENTGFAREDVPMRIEEVVSKLTRSMKKKKPNDSKKTGEFTQRACQSASQEASVEQESNTCLKSFSDELPQVGAAQLTRSGKTKKSKDSRIINECIQESSQQGPQEVSANEDLKLGSGSFLASSPQGQVNSVLEDVPALLPKEGEAQLARSVRKKKSKDQRRSDECTQEASQQCAQEVSADEDSKLGSGPLLASLPKEQLDFAHEDVPAVSPQERVMSCTRSLRKKKSKDSRKTSGCTQEASLQGAQEALADEDSKTPRKILCELMTTGLLGSGSISKDKVVELENDINSSVQGKLWSREVNICQVKWADVSRNVHEEGDGVLPNVISKSVESAAKSKDAIPENHEESQGMPVMKLQDLLVSVSSPQIERKMRSKERSMKAQAEIESRRAAHLQEHVIDRVDGHEVESSELAQDANTGRHEELVGRSSLVLSPDDAVNTANLVHGTAATSAQREVLSIDVVKSSKKKRLKDNLSHGKDFEHDFESPLTTLPEETTDLPHEEAPTLLPKYGKSVKKKKAKASKRTTECLQVTSQQCAMGASADEDPKTLGQISQEESVTAGFSGSKYIRRSKVVEFESIINLASSSKVTEPDSTSVKVKHTYISEGVHEASHAVASNIQSSALESGTKSIDTSPAKCSKYQATSVRNLKDLLVAVSSPQIGSEKRSKGHSMEMEEKNEAENAARLGDNMEIRDDMQAVESSALAEDASTGRDETVLSRRSSSFLTPEHGVDTVNLGNAGSEAGVLYGSATEGTQAVSVPVPAVKSSRKKRSKDNLSQGKGTGQDEIFDRIKCELLRASASLSSADLIGALQGDAPNIDQQPSAGKLPNPRKRIRQKDLGKEDGDTNLRVTGRDVGTVSAAKPDQSKTKKDPIQKGVFKGDVIIAEESVVPSSPEELYGKGQASESAQVQPPVDASVTSTVNEINSAVKEADARDQGTPAVEIVSIMSPMGSAVDQIDERGQATLVLDQIVNSSALQSVAQSDAVITASGRKKRNKCENQDAEISQEAQDKTEVKVELCVPPIAISSVQLPEAMNDSNGIGTRTPDPVLQKEPGTSVNPSSRKRKINVETPQGVGSESTEERLSPRRTRSGRPLGTFPPTPTSRKNMRRKLVMDPLQEEM